MTTAPSNRPASSSLASSSPAVPKARVRPAGQGDVEAICDLIARHFGKRIRRDEWRRLFDYRWGAGAPDHGWVLDQEGHIVGYLGAIYAEREIDGQVERICNLTSMCVDATHRAMAPFLIMAAVRRGDCTVTGLSARPSVFRILERAGFAPLDPGKLVVPPLFNLFGLARGRPSFEWDPDRMRPELDGTALRILDDHLSYGCQCLLARYDDRRCLLVVKRRILRILPVSEILFATDRDFMTEHIEAVTWAIIVRQRTLAVMADRRLYGNGAPAAIFLKSPSLFRSRRLEAHQIDNLYSELVLLPM